MYFNIFVMFSLMVISSRSYLSVTSNEELQQLTRKLYRFQECVQLVIDHSSHSDRLSSIIQHPNMGNVSHIVRDFTQLLEQNVYSYDAVFTKETLLTVKHHLNATCLKQCNRIFLIARNASQLMQFFEEDNCTGEKLRYYPFMEIMLVTDDVPVWMAHHLAYMHRYGLYVFWLESTYFQDDDGKQPIDFRAITNCATGQRILLPFRTNQVETIRKFMRDYDVHPIVSDAKTVFRVSHFNCPPYVFRDKNRKFDGLEHRFITELGRFWRLQERPLTWKPDNYDVSLDDLLANQTDMAMCSVWLTPLRHQQFDMTNYFDYQCGKFLVPRPDVINAASYIYLSMNGSVWIAMASSLCLTTLVLTALSKIQRTAIEEPPPARNTVYDSYSRSFLEVLSIFTGHGVNRFPYQSSINILLLCWIILSLLLGVSYSTGYTSMLSRPHFSTPIDTLDQIFHRQIRWGYIGVGNNFETELRDSTNPSYRQLYTLSELEQTIAERTEKLKTRNDYAVFVKVLLNSYVTDINNFIDEALTLRLMRQCFYNQYTVFALKKHSAYTPQVNQKILQCQEGGLLQFWARHLPIENADKMRKMFAEEKDARHSDALTMKNLSGAFWLVGIGLALSGVVFVGEYCLIIAARN